MKTKTTTITAVALTVLAFALSKMSNHQAIEEKNLSENIEALANTENTGGSKDGTPCADDAEEYNLSYFYINCATCSKAVGKPIGAFSSCGSSINH